jgi:hypothetical protein
MLILCLLTPSRVLTGAAGVRECDHAIINADGQRGKETTE